MTPIAHRIHTALHAHPGATMDDLVALTGLLRTQVGRVLAYGRTIGVIDSEQVGRVWHHYLARKPTPKPELSRLRVLAAIRRGLTTRAEIATALRMVRSTVQRATMTLEADGLILVRADGANAVHRLIATPTQVAK